MPPLLISLVSMLAQAVPMAPVANVATPTSMVYNLAVKREWTMQESDFCKNRAAANAYNAFPRSPLAKLKFIKTFSFRSRVAMAGERTMLDYGTSVGFQVPFPWIDGQWLARQYTAQLTPRYTYLLEMQDRPREANAYSAVASVCVTVFGIR